MVGAVLNVKARITVIGLVAVVIVSTVVISDECGLELTNSCVSILGNHEDPAPIIFRKDSGYWFPFVGNYLIRLSGGKREPRPHAAKLSDYYLDPTNQEPGHH